MAQQPQRQKFWISMSFLLLYTFMCGAIPFYHRSTERDLKPALLLNVDAVFTFLFMLGVGTIVAILSLNERIKALEKKSAPENQKGDD